VLLRGSGGFREGCDSDVSLFFPKKGSWFSERGGGNESEQGSLGERGEYVFEGKGRRR